MYVDSTGTDLQRNIIINDISQSNPCVITTEVDHDLHTGDQVNFFGIGGMVELNGIVAFITVISRNSFSLNGVNSTGFTAYTTGGYVGIQQAAKMEIDIITNDVGHKTQLNNLSQATMPGFQPVGRLI